MHDKFEEYILSSQDLAKKHGVYWDTPHNDKGIIEDNYIWDLSMIAGAPPTPRIILKHIGGDRKTIEQLSENGSLLLSRNWCDLIKAVIIKKIFINRNKPATIINGLVRPLKAIAACSSGKEPWELTSLDIQNTINCVKKFDNSKKFSSNICSVSKIIFDQARLSLYSPITPQFQKQNDSDYRRPKQIRKRLSERKSSNKLPNEEAFWEIIRIAWTESPNTSLDYVRFTIIRLLVLTGMRISEVCNLPNDCLQNITHHHKKISNQLDFKPKCNSLALKHFASKMRSERQDSITLFEALHHVPDMFREGVQDTIEAFQTYSEPMRDRIEAQLNTGRIFPEFNKDEIIPAFEFYARLTGEPFMYRDPLESELIEEWKETSNLEVLNRIEVRQRNLASTKNLLNRVRTYFQMRLRIKKPDGSYERAPFVYSCGNPYNEERLRYGQLHFRVGALEAFLKKCLPTKLSDHVSLKLRSGRTLSSHDLLFLAPKRAVGEGRNGRICDIRKYAFLGIIQPADIMSSLVDNKSTYRCLFQTYGKDDISRKLTITSHEFRHLQNTELFRLGVSDAIITKRFNRNSIAESHVYDHRSLAEDLKAIEIPEKAKPYLSGKSADTYRMIKAGLAKGPIVDEFLTLQKEKGDEAAFKFLSIEADGLHTTPYGHCINSFTVEPCPKHLECFSGCLHLTRSALTEHTENLKNVRKRFEKVLDAIDDHPAPPAAKEKMKTQAEERLKGIDAMLSTPVGEKVFPDGHDMSLPIKETDRGAFRD